MKPSLLTAGVPGAVLALLALVAAPAARAAEPAQAPAPAEEVKAAVAPAETPAPAEEAKEAVAPAEAPAPAEEAKAAEPVQRRNRSLEYAKELVQKGRHADALRELDTAAALPGNSNRVVMEIHATRAQALILKKNPNPQAASDLIVEVLHFDPEASMLADAPAEVRTLVDRIRAEQVLVLHDRIAVTRAGRPIKVKARLVDPLTKVAGLTLHYKPHAIQSYSTEPMRRERAAWSGLVRDPQALAPAGVADGFLIDYFVTAEDASGAVLDSNGSDESPITTEVSSTKAEEAGVGHVDLTAIRELDDKPLAAAAVPVEAVPLYRRWYVLTGAGVAVAAIVAGTVVLLSDDEPLQAHIGEINLGGK